MKMLYNRGFIYLCITVILLSTYEVVCRTLVNKIDPIQVSFFRYFLGGLILLPPAIIDLKHRKVKLSGTYLIKLALLGVLLVGISMNLFQFGLNLTRANLTAAIFCSNPIFVALMAALFLSEPLSMSKLLGLGIGLTGIIIIFLGNGNSGVVHYSGLFYLLIAAIIFSIYTVLGKKFTMEIGSLAMNSLSFIFGSVSIIPVLLIQHHPLFIINTDILPQMLYISVFVTGLAYYTYFKGLSLTDTSLGSMVFFVKPPLTFLLAALLLHEELTWSLAFGTLIVLTSIYFVQRSQSLNIKSINKRHGDGSFV